MLKWWLVTGLILLSCKTSGIVSQNERYDINHPIRTAQVDQLGNIYLLDKTNKIIKYNAAFKYQYEYADNTLGKITTIDVSDPLKILIFKKDYGILIILDNTLAELKRINLFEMDFESISAVGTALDRNIWIYDNIKYQLIKITDQGQKLLTSISMVDQGLQNIDPSFIQEKAGKLVLQDYESGVYLFDNLGQYIQTFPFTIPHNIQYDGQNIIYFEEDKIVSYNTKLFTESSVILENDLVTSSLQRAILKKGNIYYIYKEGIYRKEI